MKHTQVQPVGDLWTLQAMASSLIGHLTWRWSGLGLLQGYVYEYPLREHQGFGRQGGRRGHELRIHIWSKRLMVPGIDQNGNVHNHRFKLRSTVLWGEIAHDEYDIRASESGAFSLWDFPNANADTPEERCAMRKLDGLYVANITSGIIRAGERYTFERREYHRSYPLVDPTITLVEKLDQVDESARVLAPCDTDPVAAFGGELKPGAIMDVVLDAQEKLGEHLASLEQL